MAGSLGVCVLCSQEVTEEEHRREIDCPSKSCPGRVYHEECISGYLRRTKYSKDRCTGFPCPAILSNGKPCPGYVCKMHVFFPMNQKKKQARLVAAVAAAAAAKPRSAPVKPNAGAQVAAIAAMKRAAPEGVHPTCGFKAPKLPQNNIQLLNVETTKASLPQEPRIIPGLDPEIFDTPGKRGRAAKVKTQLQDRADADDKRSIMGGDWLDSSVNSDNDSQKWLPCANMYEAFSNSGLGGDLNFFDLEREDEHGQFSTFLKKRLMDSMPNRSSDGAKSQCKRSIGSTWPPRPVDGYIINVDPQGAQLPLSPSESPTSESHNDWNFVPSTANDTTSSVMVADQNGSYGMALSKVDAEDDGTVEYDMVYGNEDGSYLVHDSLSNAFFKLEDIYGPSPELKECLAEDGNMYMCVIVREPQLKLREQRHQAWLEAHQAIQQQQAAAAQLAVSEATMQSVFAAAESTAYDMLPPFEGAVNSTEVMGASSQCDETDVASLMQLLCV